MSTGDSEVKSSILEYPNIFDPILGDLIPVINQARNQSPEKPYSSVFRDEKCCLETEYPLLDPKPDPFRIDIAR